MVVVDQIENLCLVDVPRIGGRMKDTIGIHRVILAVALINTFFTMPPDGILTPRGQRREEVFFPGIQGFSQLLQQIG